MRLSASIVLAAGLVAAGCSGLRIDRPLRPSEADWATLGGSVQRTGVAPAALRPPLVKVWEHDVTGSPGQGGIILVDTVVFAANLRGELYGVSLTRGKRLGWVDLGVAFEGGPVMCSGRLYLGSAGSGPTLVAFDLADGKIAWQAEAGDVETSLLCTQGAVVAGSTDGTVRSFDAETGMKRWEHRIPNNAARKGFRSSPASANGLVLIGGDDGLLYALSAESGEVRWTYPALAALQSPVCVSGTTALVGDLDGTMHAVRITDGAPIWKRRLGGSIIAHPSVRGGQAFVGTTGGILFALRLSDGSIEWQRSLGGVISNAATLSEDVLYVATSRKRLYALEADSGGVLWETETQGRVRTAPVIARGVLIVGTEERLVIAYRSAS